MADPVNEPSLGNNLHPGANAGGAGPHPHQAEISILECFEDSAERRSLHVLEAVRASAIHLRMASEKTKITQVRQVFLRELVISK